MELAMRPMSAVLLVQLGAGWEHLAHSRRVHGAILVVRASKRPHGTVPSYGDVHLPPTLPLGDHAPKPRPSSQTGEQSSTWSLGLTRILGLCAARRWHAGDDRGTAERHRFRPGQLLAGLRPGRLRRREPGWKKRLNQSRGANHVAV